MIVIKKELFNDWSGVYDDVVSKNEFPFIGYEKIKEEVINSCEINHSTQILDIGVGTGNFTNEFYSRNAQCYGVDFSEKMLKIASSKMPSAYFVQHDLMNGIPFEFERAKFSVIISAYVLHHFKFEKKIEIINDYLKMLKKEDGKMFMIDISFRTREAHDKYRDKMGEIWDSSEFYFIADETIDHFENVEYKQFSECGGLYKWNIGEK